MKNISVTRLVMTGYLIGAIVVANVAWIIAVIITANELSTALIALVAIVGIILMTIIPILLYAILRSIDKTMTILITQTREQLTADVDKIIENNKKEKVRYEKET